METAVSDILQRRMHDPGGAQKNATLVVSLSVHVVVLAALAFVPGLVPQAAQTRRVVMTISLGGAPGPNAGGLSMQGGQQLEAAKLTTTPVLPPKIAPISTPSPAKMVLPDPKQKPRTPPKSNAVSKDPKGTERGRGFETREGTARVDTGARGQGFGLSTGGGGDGGVKLDVLNFCCPEYIGDMRNRIINNWNQHQKTTGVVTMFFTIQRNGDITGVQVEKSSGNPVLDLASQRALITTRRLAPLPAAFTERQLPVHLEFVYER
jgi:TonB family protein